MRSLYLIITCVFLMLFVSDNNKQCASTSLACALHKSTKTFFALHRDEKSHEPIEKNNLQKEAPIIKILITSFGAYNEFDPNPSQVLMAYVQKHHRKKNVEISFVVLESSYEYCAQWITRTNIKKYDLIIHTGVDGMAEAFELEKYAKNASYPQSAMGGYNLGENYAFENGPELYETNINLDSLLKNIQHNQCLMISEDAGGYTCNFIYYLSSYSAQHHHISTDILFVHVPPFENLDLQHQYPIFKDLLDCLIDYEYFKKQHQNK